MEPRLNWFLFPEKKSGDDDDSTDHEGSTQNGQRQHDQTSRNLHEEGNPSGQLPEDERDKWNHEHCGYNEDRADLAVEFQPLPEPAIGGKPPFKAEEIEPNDFSRPLQSIEILDFRFCDWWFNRFWLPMPRKKPTPAWRIIYGFHLCEFLSRGQCQRQVG